MSADPIVDSVQTGSHLLHESRNTMKDCNQDLQVMAAQVVAISSLLESHELGGEACLYDGSGSIEEMVCCHLGSFGQARSYTSDPSLQQ